MHLSEAFFAGKGQNAHPKYMQGLKETGITIERIPKISEMDSQLRKQGWRAVGITGFIPPEAFLELLSLRILPIACDMRKLEHLDYTPAPDIVHEAAGHAPLIIDPDYATYLAKFGEISRHVIFAKEDNDVYLAVLKLSETKEDPHATADDVQLAQKELDDALARVAYVSEAQQLSRMGWWTTEYGLIKSGSKYLIYGAGLLSSVGESYQCLDPSVPKLPLTISAIETGYDITKPQPQLFYSESFKELEDVIDELASRMSYKIGGQVGLDRALRAQTVTTTVLDTGLQMSGVLSEYKKSDDDQIDFIKFSGPVQLAFDNRQIEGQGPKYHLSGFSSPIGKLAHFGKSVADLSVADWKKFGFKPGQIGRLKFESGIELEGELFRLYCAETKNPREWVGKDFEQLFFAQKQPNSVQKHGGTGWILASFKNCKVTNGNQILFDPQWGVFDLACGQMIPSVFGGAADRGPYLKETQYEFGEARVQKSNRTSANEKMIPLYSRVRELREKNIWNDESIAALKSVLQEVRSTFSKEWLLRWELLELIVKHQVLTEFEKDLRAELNEIGKSSRVLQTLIHRGLELLN